MQVRTLSLSAVLVALAGTPAFAQESRNLFDAPQVQLPDDSPPFQRLGDFDGDGRMDAVGSRVISTGLQYQVRVWRDNQGVYEQRYSETNAVVAAYGTRMAIAVGDLDGDGDQDFVAGGGWSVFRYTNEGNFTFTRSLLWSTPDIVTDVALADIDGDGQLDLIFLTVHALSGGGYAPGVGTIGVRFATGTQVSAPGPTDLAPYTRIEVCDLDGDARPDFGCWTMNGTRFHPYSYSQGALAAQPDLVASPVIPGRFMYWTSGDIDNDGDTDLVCSELPNTEPGVGALHLFRRTSATSFTGEAPYPLGPVEFLCDIDQDGDLDGICCGGSGGSPTTWPTLNFGSYTRVSINHGGVLGPTFTFQNKGSRQLAGVADVDGDGDLDIVAGACVYYARGPLTEPPCWRSGVLGSGSVASSAIQELRSDVQDIDRDGDVDFGFSTTLKGVNDGTGALSWQPNTLPLAKNLVAGRPVCRGDFDGDGAPDLLVPVLQSSNQQFVGMKLLRNNGSGTLLQADPACDQRIGWMLYSFSRERNAFVVGDVDNDGDLDVIATSDPTYETTLRCEIWHNVGLGKFVAGPQLQNERIDVVADFDGDGIADFVTRTNYPSSLRLRLGTGVASAPFAAPIALFPGVMPDLAPGSVLVVDADDDGRPDLMIESHLANDNDVVIYCNTTAAPGAPAFAAPVTFGPVFRDASCPSIADFDGDGRSDVAITHQVGKGATTSIYLRTSPAGAPLTYAAPIDQAILDGYPADVDGDGDIDMLGSYCIRNVHWSGPAGGVRQQYGTGTAGQGGIVPLLGSAGPVRAGSTIEMRLVGFTGGAPALLGISAARADLWDVPLPGLRLLVDPSQLLTVTLPLGQPGLGVANGSTGFSLLLPPGLAGVDFCDQAFVFDAAAPGGIACSNGLWKHIGG
jgi:hypothetical protein